MDIGNQWRFQSVYKLNDPPVSLQSQSLHGHLPDQQGSTTRGK
jgi:hypothetical protein